MEIEKAKKRLEFEKEELQNALEVQCTVNVKGSPHSWALLEKIATIQTSADKNWEQINNGRKQQRVPYCASTG